MGHLSSKALFHPTVLLAMALLGIIVMMVLPVPAWLLDAGLAASFALAILIFTITLFVERPLDFSSFPTILLASLMLRLALNVSSTKLIIAEGHTGRGGKMPVNPNGGLMGEAYIHGMNNIVEAVRQIRGQAANQVPNVERVLVSGGSALILGTP